MKVRRYIEVETSNGFIVRIAAPQTNSNMTIEISGGRRLSNVEIEELTTAVAKYMKELTPASFQSLKKKSPTKLCDTPISELDLSNRAQHCLQSAGIRFIGELLMKTEKDMLKIRDFGRGTLREVVDVLSRQDVDLNMAKEVAATNWKPPAAT